MISIQRLLIITDFLESLRPFFYSRFSCLCSTALAALIWDRQASTDGTR